MGSYKLLGIKGSSHHLSRLQGDMDLGGTDRLNILIFISVRRILYNSPPMPPDISREVSDLLHKLLQKDPKLRLGAKGAHEIQAHSFFKVRVI